MFDTTVVMFEIDGDLPRYYLFDGDLSHLDGTVIDCGDDPREDEANNLDFENVIKCESAVDASHFVKGQSNVCWVYICTAW